MITAPKTLLVCKMVTGAEEENEARKGYGENAPMAVGGRQGLQS